MTNPVQMVLELSDGKTVHALRSGQAFSFKAQAGAVYRVMQRAGDDPSSVAEWLNNVIAKRVGNDLQLFFSDGTQVTLENYFIECRSGGCDVILPGPEPAGYSLSADSAAGAALNDGSTLVYAHGNEQALLTLVQDNSVALHSMQASTSGLDMTYVPAVAHGISGIGDIGTMGWIGGLGLGLLAAVAGGGGGGGGSNSGSHPTPPPTTSTLSVNSVAITSAVGQENNRLNAGDVISVSVDMNATAIVQGTPQLALTIGGATVQAHYVSGSGSAKLVFSYTILAGDADSDGVSIGANSLTLNDGSIGDAAGHAAILSHAQVADNAGYLVDTSAPTLVASSPSDHAPAVWIGSNIVLTMSENVMPGSGNIVISNGAGDHIIAISDTTQVSISGATVTINPNVLLSGSSNYHISIASGVLQDLAGNPYGGIVDSTTLVFATLQPVPVWLSDISSGVGGFVVNGQCAYDESGWSVASAGDVNGDGMGDVIIGAHYSSPASGTAAGRSYVVFGQTSSGLIELNDVAAGSGGFVINGVNAYDASGISVASARDINGDGLTDLIIGAPSQGSAIPGQAYVVFGKTGTSAIDLSAIAAGSGGFVIHGECDGDQAGFSVASAGDVNGDGMNDLIIGARYSSLGGTTRAGRSYVVFGQAVSSAIELSAVAAGTGGFVINGQCLDEDSGHTVSSAGDVNGDGLADLLIGTNQNVPASGDAAGRSYVVFGQSGTQAINLSAVAAGTGGFVITGQCAGDYSGFSTASAGDVNGDGLSDLLVGAMFSHPAAGVKAGRSYVVFGKADGSAVSLAAIAAGTGGFVINGECGSDLSGSSVTSAGDMNGDGLTDMIVNAMGASISGAPYSGRSYVVFGKTDTSAVDLSAVGLGVGGFVINGQCADDAAGWSAASAGDINGDGLSDLIVSSKSSSPASGFHAGSSYIIWGAITGAFAQSAINQLGTSANETLTGTSASEALIGGAGNDILIGNGGADVLYGGAGNDTITLNASNIAALTAPAGSGDNLSHLARVDGGSGIDTLGFSGAGITFDLTVIANQGDDASRITSVERIDLSSSASNVLILNLKDVLDMTGMNNFNNALGWLDGSYNLAAGGANGANPEARHQLVVDGVAGDAVHSSGWGAALGTVTNGGHTYVVYNQGLAQLLIDQNIVRSIV